MINLFLFLVVLFFSFCKSGDRLFEYEFGSGIAVKAFETSDGGGFACGHSKGMYPEGHKSIGKFHVVGTKIGSDGKILWTKGILQIDTLSPSDTFDYFATDCIEGSSGFYIVGQVSGNHTIFIKLDGKSGDVIFFRLYSDFAAKSVDKTDDGELIVAGYSKLHKGGMLFKFSPNDNLVWCRVQNSTDLSKPSWFNKCVYHSLTNKIYCVGAYGESAPPPSVTKALFGEYSTSGNKIVVKYYYTIASSKIIFKDIVVTNYGNPTAPHFAITGRYQSSDASGMIVLKMSDAYVIPSGFCKLEGSYENFGKAIMRVDDQTFIVIKRNDNSDRTELVHVRGSDPGFKEVKVKVIEKNEGSYIFNNFWKTSNITLLIDSNPIIAGWNDRNNMIVSRLERNGSMCNSKEYFSNDLDCGGFDVNDGGELWDIGNIQEMSIVKYTVVDFVGPLNSTCYSCNGQWNTDVGVCGGDGTCTLSGKCVFDCHGILSNSSQLCSGHGTCKEKNRCVCYENYVGKFCNITKCFGIFSNHTDVCGGRGKCYTFDNCSCGIYGGKNCTSFSCDKKNPGETGVCSGMGECLAPEYCQCSEGWDYKTYCGKCKKGYKESGSSCLSSAYKVKTSVGLSCLILLMLSLVYL